MARPPMRCRDKLLHGRVRGVRQATPKELDAALRRQQGREGRHDALEESDAILDANKDPEPCFAPYLVETVKELPRRYQGGNPA